MEGRGGGGDSLTFLAAAEISLRDEGNPDRREGVGQGLREKRGYARVTANGGKGETV